MNTAIGYAHYQLGGGNRALIRWCVGFIILAFVGLSAYSRYGGGGTIAAAAASTTPAMLLLAVILVLLINGRIGNALKLDNSLEMSRSHRLMAVSAPSAVLGYLLGPSLQFLAVAGLVVAYLIGGYIAGGYDLAAFIAALGLLVAFASAVATLNVMSGIGGKGGGIGWLWGVGAGALFGTGGAIFGAVPWTVALLAPFGGRTILRLHDVQGISVGHAVGAFMHFSLAGIFFTAACRRWRNVEKPALSPMLWLGLIGLVVVGTLAGVQWYPEMRLGAFRSLEPVPAFTVPATLILLILLAHGPFKSHERLAAAWRLRRNVADPAADADRPSLPAWAIMGLISLLLVPLGLLVPEFDSTDGLGQQLFLPIGPTSFISENEFHFLRDAWLATSAAVLAALVTAWAVVRGLLRMRSDGLIIWVYVVLWVLPVAIGVAQALWVQGDLGQGPGRAAMFSLPGALYFAWSGNADPLWLGIGVAYQCIVAAALALISLRVPDRIATPATREQPQSKITPIIK